MSANGIKSIDRPLRSEVVSPAYQIDIRDCLQIYIHEQATTFAISKSIHIFFILFLFLNRDISGDSCSRGRLVPLTVSLFTNTSLSF